MNKKIHAIYSVIIILLLAGVGYAVPAKTNSDTLKYLEFFGDAFSEIKKRYVEEVDDKKLIEAAVSGMLSSLDPHSGYLDKEEYAEFMVGVKGEFGGLGIEVTTDNGLVRVVSPIDDTPAHRAGIKSGDYIVAVDDESVLGMSLNDTVKLMRGEAGKKIHLTIIREGKNEPIEIDLIREIIKIKTVKSRMINDIAYFRIGTFSEQTADSLKAEIDKVIASQTIKKIQGIILDLRDNPGGVLDQAISVTDLFLDEGEVVSIKGRNASEVVRYNVTGKNNMFGKIKMVVLVNGGSASASEIVAGALQDHKRAIIMGAKSFGKASVQSAFEVPPFGGIKFTTARYYTPSGRSIQAEGIVPDIEVKEAKIEMNDLKDNRRIFSESKLKGHLKQDPKKGEKIDSKELIEKINNGNKDQKKPDEDYYKTDFQLARALDLLKALSVLNDQ